MLITVSIEELNEILINCIVNDDTCDTYLDMSFLDLGYDSIDLLELMMKIEEEANIELTDESAVMYASTRDDVRKLKTEMSKHLNARLSV